MTRGELQDRLERALAGKRVAGLDPVVNDRLNRVGAKLRAVPDQTADAIVAADSEAEIRGILHDALVAAMAELEQTLN